MESRGSERVHSDELYEVELNESCRRFESFQRDNDGPASEFTKKGIQNGGAGGEVDMQKVEYEESKRVLDKLIKHPEDNESLLLKLKHRVSIEQPTVEVRFENINVDAEAYVGRKAIPTIFNSCVNAFQDVLHRIRILPNKKEKISILQNVSGILRPGRMTLLLGPPGSGKTTLLSILAGKSTPGLKACVSEKSHNRIVTDYILRVSPFKNKYGKSQAVYLSEEALKEKQANRIGKEVKNTAQNIWKSPSRTSSSTPISPYY
ncbi:ABC transporter-like, ATP-binding domain [Dillenia turbinata]|uniref:ABC transporter-like, ATP-binding domain n=1 Tax=Dillenia turbinata TaxID=194707 RepID=A0AAN8ZTU1_9MAGN